MSTTLHCDACGKIPSPEVNANEVSIEVDIRAFSGVRVHFSAKVDLCHECRNIAIKQLWLSLDSSAENLEEENRLMDSVIKNYLRIIEEQQKRIAGLIKEARYVSTY